MTRLLSFFAVTAALVACGAKPPTPAAPSADSATTTSHDAPSHDTSDARMPDSRSPAAGLPEPADPAGPHPAAAELDPKIALLTAETSAWEAARPVVMAHCAACHTRTGKKAAKKKLAHFALDTYPLGGHHTRTIGFTIREVVGLTGKKPTMPYDEPGAVQGEELATIKAWTDAWEAAETAGAHSPSPAGEHD